MELSMQLSDTNVIMVYVRKVREAMNITQKELAKRIDISPRQYARAESGESKIGGGELLRAAEILNLSIPHLVKLADKNATHDDAEALAQELLAARMSRMGNQVVNLAEVVNILDAAQNPEVLQELRDIIAKRRGSS